MGPTAAPAAPGGASGAPVAPATAALDPNEAQALEALTQRDPADVGARVELGHLYNDHQRWDEAAPWYREALALTPDLPEIRNELGACLVQAGRPAEGLAEFEAVLQQDEGNRNALYNKGIALTQLGRAEEAIAAWEEVLRQHPDDPQLVGLQGQIDALRGLRGT